MPVAQIEKRNYLRVRGEYLDTAQAMAKHVELPPRARRIRAPSIIFACSTGTTSACAENTQFSFLTSPFGWNYLRVRGEYKKPGFSGKNRWELPPRARRIRSSIQRLYISLGTTSACAENT